VKRSPPRSLIVQWVALTGMLAVAVYLVVYDLSSGQPDNLLALWAILAAMAFIGSTLTGLAIWRSRSTSR
jgi:hypothetical protein